MRISAVILVILLLAPLAQAGTVFEGEDLRIEVLWPNLGSVAHGPVDVVVGPGVEIPSIGGAGLSVDVSDTQIRIDASRAFSFGAVLFNGFHFEDYTTTIPEIGGVTVNSTFGWTGFTAAKVSHDGDNIWIDVGGTACTSTGYLLFDVAPRSASVPLPSAAWLGLGLLGLLGAARRMRKRAA